MKSFCLSCSIPTNQEVLNENEFEFESDDHTWFEISTYQIIKCKGCDDVSFRKLYRDITNCHDETENSLTQELYPKRGVHSSPIKEYKNLPEIIKNIYKETKFIPYF